MKISSLIEQLKELQEKHGDLDVCKTSDHEYWGTVYDDIEEARFDEHAQPDGPKNNSRPCITVR